MDNNIIDTEKMKVRYIKDNAEIRILFNPESTSEKEIINKLNNYDSLLAALDCLVQDIEHYSKVGVLPSSTAINKAKEAIQKAEQ